MSTSTAVTVIGLGAMGRALAEAFLASGHTTTVWNRTPGRAGDLAADGADVAPDPAAAVAASPLTVVCVLDHDAVHAVVDAAGSALDGATIVNLTSSTPEDARAVAERVTGAGARYLDGKIMVPTPLVGTADAFYLYSGDRSAYDDHRVTLDGLGGAAEHLGEEPGLASLFDLGMLDVFFNGMAAFLHAAALVGADGISAGAFLPYADRVLDVVRVVLPALAADVDGGTHPGDEDNLVMDLAALEHIVAASRTRGIDPALPDAVRRLTAAAVEAGHGADGLSRVVDLLRPRRAAAA